LRHRSRNSPTGDHGAHELANGATIAFSYDGDGRAAGNGNGAFTYDGNGHMLTASSANGDYAFSYDDDGRLTEVTEPGGYTLHYAYDGVGNQTQEIDHYGGTVNSTYDADNYLTQRTYGERRTPLDSMNYAPNSTSSTQIKGGPITISRRLLSREC
jgi:YD repeat-containing protein